VYGIPNCNTVKKALDWLNANKIAYEFHDYKKKGISTAKLKTWSTQIGWEKLVNKKATWNQLDEAIKACITNETAAVDLLAEKPSIIKRPLIEKDGKVITLGFDESEYEGKVK
jgi:Spx/MgsR family transcriptional regulator